MLADEGTLQAIASAQNEFTTRVRPTKTYIEEQTPVIEEMVKPMKKRPASRAGGAKKPPTKKLKMDPSEERGTPGSIRRSATPSSVSGKMTKGPVKNRKGSHSATSFGSSPPPPPAQSPEVFDMSDVEDADALYCICRRPDNHTFMIACDGGCEDWFHGKCVNVKKEDEDLVDKYICPNCEQRLGTVTTWKPMCRRPGCRKPARLRKGAESKYCSQDCGLAFMKDYVSRTGRTETLPKPRRKLTNDDPHTSHRDSSPDLGPMGGSIRPHELKALAASAPDVSTFRHLGESAILTPPESPETYTKETHQQITPLYTPAEQTRIAAIETRKDILRQRRTLLKDRERLVVLVKERAARLAETANVKNFCGLDPRVSWDDACFITWRDSDAGRAAFSRGSLDAEAEAAPDDSGTSNLKPRPQAVSAPSSTSIVLTGGISQGDGAVCTKRNCDRHKSWRQLVLQDVRFEEADVGDEMRRIDGEERELRERGMMRARMRKGGLGEEDGGSVEVIGEVVDVGHDREGDGVDVVMDEVEVL